jgi:hypothetical protein
MLAGKDWKDFKSCLQPFLVFKKLFFTEILKLTKIRLNKAFSLGGSGCDDGILSNLSQTNQI